MSWTSEFDPPPPRPSLDNELDGHDVDDGAVIDVTDGAADGMEPVLDGDGFAVVDVVDESMPVEGSGPATNGASNHSIVNGSGQEPSSAIEVPDDGPLDPSVFDGLFADLGPYEAPTPSETTIEPASEPDEPTTLDDDTDGNLDEAGNSDRGDSGDNDAGSAESGYQEPRPRNSGGLLFNTDGSENHRGTTQAEEAAAAEEPLTTDQDNGQVADNPTIISDDLAAAFDSESTLFATDAVAADQALFGQEAVVDNTVHVPGVDLDSLQHPATAAPLNQESAPHHQPIDHQHQQPMPGPMVGYELQKPRRRWPSFAIATIVGALFGIGGALLLFQVLDLGNRRATPDQTAAPTGTVPVVDASNATSATTPAEAASGGLVGLAATGRFELNTVRFTPGTSELTESSRLTLTEMAEAMALHPEQAASITVRTYSESTPTENRALSVRQAEKIEEFLIALDAPPASVTVRGIGPALLSPAQPVQSFVVPSAGLQPSALKRTVQEFSPFAIGLDPVTNQLRPESIEPLDALGRAMAADPATRVSLASYSYDEADEQRNEELAAAAAEAAAAYLITAHNVGREAISILTPGQAPYIVGPELGNHVFVQWGEAAAVANSIMAAEEAGMRFAPGSAGLSPEAIAALDQVIAVVADKDLTVLVEVSTSTESTAVANETLSVQQAEAIRLHLLDGGLAEQRVRTYGGGDLRQFQGGEPASRVVFSVVQ